MKGVQANKLLTWILVPAIMVIVSGAVLMTQSAEKNNMSYNELTPEEKSVILEKGTEPPFSGKYYKHDVEGTYLCRQCDAPLFKSGDKFDSGCGWPSFDDAIPGAVKEQPDADGRRTEIVCASCGGHLGHVFFGEGFTAKNTRHCVNSLSLGFAPTEITPAVRKAYFAGGCFWGTEYYLEQAAGVIKAQVGYMGGTTEKPDYQEVCSGTTGHAETVEVVFDPSVTDFETLARLFFEIHDPTQVDRQGPDIGSQYRSAVFYTDDDQKAVAERLIRTLESKGYSIATELAPAGRFWPAEDYHQDYYDYTGKQPYCHSYQKRF
jgi:peptide methionine sulfoxide reductase msrA/msrB